MTAKTNLAKLDEIAALGHQFAAEHSVAGIIGNALGMLADIVRDELTAPPRYAVGADLAGFADRQINTLTIRADRPWTAPTPATVAALLDTITAETAIPGPIRRSVIDPAIEQIRTMLGLTVPDRPADRLEHATVDDAPAGGIPRPCTRYTADETTFPMGPCCVCHVPYLTHPR